MKKLNCENNLINNYFTDLFFSEQAKTIDIFNYIIENDFLRIPPLNEKDDCINIGEDFIYISTDECRINIQIEKIVPIF